MALSHAADEQAHPSAAADTADTNATADASAASATTGAGSPLLTQAQRWLKDSGLQDTLTQVPEPLRRLASQGADRWRQLTTTQKIVGGALLAAGGWYLLSRPSQGRASGASSKQGRGNQAATLHELLLFVNDRVEGYQRAASESKDSELQSYYRQLVSQSQQFASRLNNYLRQQDGGRETSTTLKGKFYRLWMETKAAVTGYDEQAILGSNVYGEEWAIKAYEEALQDNTLSGSLRSEVQRQYDQSKQTYQKLQQLQKQQSK
jgi:uncharacterized protein (TIGR02284 family)